MEDHKDQILFEKFKIIDCLKKDIYTSVFLAEHLYLGKKILLKTLNTKNINDTSSLGRFKREAKNLARLDHPNIIKVLDFGSFGHSFYISFEYFESNNLRNHISKKILSIHEKQDIIIKLAQGLEAAHDAGIIHRDIKPANILIDDKHQVKIADFGLAIAIDENLLTSKSSIVGTPAYMSPEQIRGEDLTAQSDLFSLGIIAYELFTGKNPFIGRDINATINNILNAKESTIEKGLANVPNDIKKLILSLIKVDRSLRIESAKKILELLDIHKKELPDTSKPDNRRFFKRFAFAATLFIVIVLITLYLIQDRSRETIESIEGKKRTDENQIRVDTQPDLSISSTKSKSQPQEKGKISQLSEESRIAQKDEVSDKYIDSQFIDTTSGQESVPAKLSQLKDSTYTDDEKEISSLSEQYTQVEIYPDTLLGYLICRVYPWGNISIDGRAYGQTPLLEPIALKQGRYLIQIKNTNYPAFSDSISIIHDETTDVRINLEQLSKITKSDSS
jgi:serine/threonine-protein kinase